MHMSTTEDHLPFVKITEDAIGPSGAEINFDIAIDDDLCRSTSTCNNFDELKKRPALKKRPSNHTVIRCLVCSDTDNNISGRPLFRESGRPLFLLGAGEEKELIRESKR